MKKDIITEPTHIKNKNNKVCRNKVEWWLGVGKKGKLFFNGFRVSDLQDENLLFHSKSVSEQCE